MLTFNLQNVNVNRRMLIFKLIKTSALKGNVQKKLRWIKNSVGRWMLA